MPARQIKSVILSRHQSLRSIYKQNIHQLIAMRIKPEHTIIIEIDITSSVAKNAHQKNYNHLRQQIITTCRDADVT
jgi:hypothetical protein